MTIAVDDVAVGDTIVVAEPGFPDLPAGTEVEVYMTLGPSPRLAVTGGNGVHPLAGYLHSDGVVYGGVNYDNEYLGFDEPE